MRCTGHCCKRFAIEHSYEELQKDLTLSKENPKLSKIKDIEIIATMVIPIASSSNGKEHVYTCSNLRSNGDCGIYETRPQMCRDFPEPKNCHFWKCTSSDSAYAGLPLWRKILTRYQWLRRLTRENL